MIVTHRNPLPSDFAISAPARLLALGSIGRLQPSRQDVSWQWLKTSLQPPSPITAAGPPRFCTVFRSAEANTTIKNHYDCSRSHKATTIFKSTYTRKRLTCQPLSYNQKKLLHLPSIFFAANNISFQILSVVKWGRYPVC